MKYLPLLLFMTLAGCEKTINIQPEGQKPLLVVDGTIENGQAPVIILSKSLNYFSAINADILVNSLVKGAIVTLSNAARTVPLKEYSRSIGGGYSIIYYSNDSTNPAASMIGELGKTYTLNIEYDGKEYSSTTQIPLIDKTVDSLWWKQAPHNDDTTKIVLMGRFTDPVGYGDYVRYFTKVNSDDLWPGFNSVFDDQIIDGTTYDVQVDRGVDRNNMPERDDYGYFSRGDTVTLKFSNIDKGTFDFWRTLEFSYQSVGNPFASPTKVISNVSNGALGAFCGYGSQYKTLIIPK